MYASETMAMLSNQVLPENLSLYLNKLRLGTVIVHLATRITEFAPIFHQYCKVTSLFCLVNVDFNFGITLLCAIFFMGGWVGVKYCQGFKFKGHCRKF